MKDVAECAVAETSKVAGATLEDALEGVKVGKALAQQADCSKKLAECEAAAAVATVASSHWEEQDAAR